MILYKTTNCVTGKIYIGQSRYNDPNYLGSGSLITKAIKKYGKESFQKEILEYVLSNDELDEREKYWIAYYNSTDPNIGYNLALGGNGNKGHVPSIETRKKISESKRGKKLTEKHIENIRKGHVGIKHSEESKNKRSDKLKGRCMTDEHKKKLSESAKGRKQSEETKKKISDKIKGRIESKETKEKKRQSMLGKNVGKIPWNKSALPLEANSDPNFKING